MMVEPILNRFNSLIKSKEDWIALVQTIMTDKTKPNGIGLLLYPEDTARLSKIKEQTGIKTNSEVLRYALAKLAQEVKIP